MRERHAEAIIAIEDSEMAETVVMRDELNAEQQKRRDHGQTKKQNIPVGSKMRNILVKLEAKEKQELAAFEEKRRRHVKEVLGPQNKGLANSPATNICSGRHSLNNPITH